MKEEIKNLKIKLVIECFGLFRIEIEITPKVKVQKL